MNEKGGDTGKKKVEKHWVRLRVSSRTSRGSLRRVLGLLL